MCFHVCMYVYINTVQWSGMTIFGLLGYVCVCVCVYLTAPGLSHGVWDL